MPGARSLRQLTALGTLLVGAAGTVAAADTPAAIDGAAAFVQNCQMCHQAGGAGLAGAFPRLAGRVSAISTKPAGRAYLVDVLTYGMAGTVTVDKQTIVGLMPPFAQLSSAEVAAILSYVQTQGAQPSTSPAPFTADEVTAGREQSKKNAADVLAERRLLEKSKVVE